MRILAFNSQVLTCLPLSSQGRVAMIIGHCNYCNSDFCGAHRLPETHQCQAMASCKEQAFNRNAQKLEASKCIAAKV
jgi:predicted nucleic acid binding AN1-type Zn finger protein